MHLAIDDHRIDDGADIIDPPISDERDLPGVGIDLDLAGVRTVAEREARRIVDRGVLQARLDLLKREIVRDVGGTCDLRERELAVGACDREGAVGELDVVRRGFEQVTGNQLALGDDLGCGAIKGAAANRDAVTLFAQ